MLGVFNKLKNMGPAYAEALIEQAGDLITDVCADHVLAAKHYVRDATLRELLSRKIEAECQELIEYIFAAKRFNLEINSRSKDRVISFGEKLACLFMTTLLQDAVCAAPSTDPPSMALAEAC